MYFDIITDAENIIKVNKYGQPRPVLHAGRGAIRRGRMSGGECPILSDGLILTRIDRLSVDY